MKLFHAYQNNAAYPGGTAQYTTNGRANIEFEAEVMKDINTAITGLGDWAIIDNAYQNWIYSLIEPNNSFPTQFDANDSNFFLGFLNEWLYQNQSAYPGATKNQNSPKAIIHLANNNPC